MAWGGSKKAKHERDEPVPEIPEREGTTLIGKGVVIKGLVQSDEDITIAGSLEGDLSCRKTIQIVPEGTVKGNVSCDSIVIHGTLEGDVTAEEQITVAETGRLTGDITTPCFKHLPGGFFQGYSHMVNRQDVGKKEGKQ